MPRLTAEDKELILADYHTGHYTQRELSKKYECSTATVNKLTKGKEPKHEQKVNAIVEAHGALYSESEQNEHEVNAVHSVIDEKTRYLKMINDNASKLAGKLNTMIDHIDTPNDALTIANANDKLAITLKVADRHAPKIDVTQLQQQSSNTPTTVNIIEDKAVNDG